MKPGAMCSQAYKLQSRRRKGAREQQEEEAQPQLHSCTVALFAGGVDKGGETVAETGTETRRDSHGASTEPGRLSLGAVCAS